MVKSSRAHAGFTLIEMLVTLAVFAILAGIAIPSFTSVIADQKVKNTASELQSALLSTRSEALKRNANVAIAPVSGVWTSGWTITVPATGEILSSNNLSTTTSITGPASIIYNNAGRISFMNVNTTFKFSSAATSTIRCLTVDLSGLPTMASSGC